MEGKRQSDQILGVEINNQRKKDGKLTPLGVKTPGVRI